LSTVQSVSARQSPADDEAVANAVQDLRAAVQSALQVSPELSRIREQQRTFLRANQKFPDFLDVGIGVWESVHDWHVRHQSPLTVTRLGDGRYAMSVLFTTLILRPDQSETYIGFGYDAR
jgi:hypothetical protein